MKQGRRNGAAKGATKVAKKVAKKSTIKAAKPRRSAAIKPANTSPKTAVPAGALIEPKKVAPSFTLLDGAGKPHSLADYKGKQVILYFYPRDNTPGCTQEACQFRDLHPAIKRGNTVVLGVSPDSQKSHASFSKKFSLPFTLLVDAFGDDATPAVSRAYGVWQKKSMYGRSYMGIMRTTYLIGKDGKVIRRWDKVSVTDHGAEVVAALDS